MKKLITIFVILFSLEALAQQNEEQEEVKQSFFKKENLFVGGGINLGFATGQFAFGVGPYVGYSLNKFLDLGIALNYDYISQRYENSTYKVRQTIIGPAPFVRVFPLKFIFLQATYENNAIKYKEIYGNGFPDIVTKFNVESLLVGAGYASDREKSGDGFFYISLLFDVANNNFSPYRVRNNNVTPIIRSGIHYPLFQNKRGRRIRSN